MSGLSIAVAGATTALGEEILATLEKAPVDIGRVLPLDLLSVEKTSVRFKGEELPVGMLSADVLEGVELVFAANAPGPDTALLKEAAEAGCIVIDLAGHWAGDSEAPVMALGSNPAALEDVRQWGVAVAPDAVALVLTALGLPIHQQFGLHSVRGTAMRSASAAGQAGIRELSGQVAALFNSQDPPRKVFEHGLAFDLLPAWGEPMAEGWTIPELLTSRHAGLALGLEPERFSLTETVAPMFVGLAMSLHIQPNRPVSAEQLKGILGGRPGLELVDRDLRKLMPRAQTGSATVAVGRLRDDRMGQGLHLWAAADPLRLTAANAVAVFTDLVEQGLI